MAEVPENLTAENEATYDSLMSLIENNQDRLALILVACDDLRLRQRVIGRYESEARPAKIRPYRIVLGTEPSLRAGLAKLELRQGDAAVVTVTGAEWLLRVKMREKDEQSDLDKFFGYLQWTREGLREFRCPIVLWVTHQVLREMHLKAPDFWSWRKAVLRFESQEVEPILVRTIEERAQPVQSQPEEEFLPPLEELLSEIQQLESTSPEAANLATLYDKLGQVYAKRILSGKATNLKQERQQAINVFQNAIQRYQQLNNQSELADVFTSFGNFLYAQSRYAEAIDFYQQSLEIEHEISDRKGEAAALNGLGNAYYSLGQYERAINFHQQSLEIKREIGDRKGEAASLSNLGLVHDALGQYQQSINFYQQSLEIDRENRDRFGEAISLNNLGIAYDSLEQYQRAIDLHQQSLKIQLAIGNRHGEALSLSNLGVVYNSLGQYQRAIDLHQQSLEIRRKIGDRNGEASSLSSLGNLHYSIGQYQRAIDCYEQSSEIQHNIGNRHDFAVSLHGKALALAKYQSRRFEALTTLQQARKIYAVLQLDHEVEECDKAIRTFNQIITTEERQSTPSLPVSNAPTQDDWWERSLPTQPTARSTSQRQINWVLWFCVGIAIVLLIAWLLK